MTMRIGKINGQVKEAPNVYPSLLPRPPFQALSGGLGEAMIYNRGYTERVILNPREC